MQAEGVLKWIHLVAERARLGLALGDVHLCCGVEMGVCPSASKEFPVMIATCPLRTALIAIVEGSHQVDEKRNFAGERGSLLLLLVSSSRGKSAQNLCYARAQPARAR